uniref:Uncharacterized protein n=1 Tax=Romanomermis culicivorax TaxID=13658 RepID=A0A915L152_ROMCU
MPTLGPSSLTAAPPLDDDLGADDDEGAGNLGLDFANITVRSRSYKEFDEDTMAGITTSRRRRLLKTQHENQQSKAFTYRHDFVLTMPNTALVKTEEAFREICVDRRSDGWPKSPRTMILLSENQSNYGQPCHKWHISGRFRDNVSSRSVLVRRPASELGALC